MPRARVALFVLAASGAFAGEVRGVWIARDTLGSREQIAKAMSTLASANFNVAFVNAWSQGYTLWPSKVFERETGVLIDPRFEGRDVMAEAVEEGQRAGISIIPWLEYGFAGVWSGRLTGESLGPVFDRHPDWLARNRGGEARFPLAAGGYYYWMIHTHPEAQDFLISLMEELVRTYDIPGVQFDRARYPALDCGYDDYTKKLYADEHDGRMPPDDPAEAGWIRWRADKLNAFIAEMHRRVKEADWRALVTNAPTPTPDGYRSYAQDPPGWIRDKALDFVSPQLYWRDAPTYRSKLELHIRALEAGSRLVPGVAVSVSDPDALVRIIEITREYELPSVVILYYEDLVKAGAFEKLRATVFERKERLPWRDSHVR